MSRIGPKVAPSPLPNANPTTLDPTWTARIGTAQFKKDGLTPLDLANLPKTLAVRAVLDMANKNPNSPTSPLAERPPYALSAFRDEKSRQFAVLVWEPADFMGKLHVFDAGGAALGTLQIHD